MHNNSVFCYNPDPRDKHNFLVDKFFKKKIQFPKKRKLVINFFQHENSHKEFGMNQISQVTKKIVEQFFRDNQIV